MQLSEIGAGNEARTRDLNLGKTSVSCPFKELARRALLHRAPKNNDLRLGACHPRSKWSGDDSRAEARS